MKIEALFYQIEGDFAICMLCPHGCHIKEGNRGVCRVRGALRDESGNLRLYTFNYGEVSSLALDPIEKKPLVNFFPGTFILSVGSYGCNLKCLFCQNYHIAHEDPHTVFMSPEDMVKKIQAHTDSIGIAFTYNEPTVWYECVLDTAMLLKKHLPDKKVVLVTNGYINETPLKKLLPYIDAMNIDLKGDDNFYRNICSGTMPEVMQTIKIADEMGVHVEVSTLIIGKINSDDETLIDIGEFIKNINPDITLHISRYFPCYKMSEPPTEIETIGKSYHTLKKILPDVRVGNLTLEELRSIIEI
ncbi:radical SAM protein [Proteocatella sphenisci]|uniref:radical SAM protein n=1 Tax=Proteocatella sphenisci TaxID=181070 RepID=UPI00048B8C03|nr:radical SAM protein [Proteocatella sphenisci]